MKIGIITFHFPYNCGAVLQCAALQTYLEMNGHEVSIINYRPWYHQNRYIPLKNPVYFGRKSFGKRDASDKVLRRMRRCIGGVVRTIYSWRNYHSNIGKHRKFESFIKKYLHETRIYRTMDQLQKFSPMCDVYISGSDQLWNPHLTDGKFDPAYFLQFGNDDIKRIAYAVSPNLRGIIDPEGMLGTLLDDFDALSLREDRYLSAVQDAAGNKKINICLDPVFLLDAQDYDRLIGMEPLEKEPFILTYTMPDITQHRVFNAADILSEELGIKVIDVSGNPSKVNSKIKDNRVCGPDEFLWYIKNAEYVITNSFHGTAFSVIFRKEFVSIPHQKTGNRVMELLNAFDLSSRWTNTGESAANIITDKIDYESKTHIINSILDDSRRFLHENI